MSSNGIQVGKRDRSTLYGVFIIAALGPTAFAVAYGHQPRGVESGRPWLTALLPMVLLLAARFIPPVWRRSRLLAVVVTAVAGVAGCGFAWNLAGLLAFVGITAPVRLVAAAVVVAAYATFAAVAGSTRNRRCDCQWIRDLDGGGHAPGCPVLGGGRAVGYR